MKLIVRPASVIGLIRAALFAAALAGLEVASVAQEEIPEPYRSLIPEVQKRILEFPEVPVGTVAGEHWLFTAQLDEKPVVIDGKHRFGCIRFTTPKEAPLDMVWAFTVPEGWAHWYIVPATGSMEGFRNWLTADRLYQDLPATQQNLARLQTLAAASLKPGNTYVLWFKEEAPAAQPAKLTAVINFLAPLPADKEWDHEKIEKALGLKASPAAQQVEYLDSRGGRILLDSRFFKPDYAAGRIDDVLLSLRRAWRSRSGMFVEMMIEMPPCKTDPALADVRAAHGEPDFILPSDQRRIFDRDAAPETVCYYDYFGFTIGLKKDGEHIVSVLTQAPDVSRVRPQRDGLTWGDVPLPQVPVRVFYRDKKEIARVAFWGKENGRVLSGELPVGTYRRDYPSGQVEEELKHLGKGEWEFRSYFESGAAARTAGLRNHAWHGLLRDSFEDGKPQAEVTYDGGRIDGVLRQWNEAGELRELRFKNGERVDEGEGKPAK